MMMRANVLVAAAFVAVVLFSCDGSGSITVAARETTAVAGGGGGEDEGETSRGARMATGVNGVPATSRAQRKLIKNNKVSQDGGALSKENAMSLVRKLVFKEAAALFCFMTMPGCMQQPELEASYPVVRRAENNGRALQFSPCGGSCGDLIEHYVKEFAKEECVKCLNFFENGQRLNREEQSAVCQGVVSVVVENNDLSWENYDFGVAYCTSALMQCASTATPTSCCQSQRLCLDID